MEIEFYYADIDVKVQLTSREGGFIGDINDTETQILQQIVYMALNQFCYTRAMLLVERTKANELEGQNEGLGRG